MNSADDTSTYTYWARYAPSAARTYTIRGWIGVAIWIGLAVLFGLTLPADNPALRITVATIMLFGAALAAHAAMRSRERWGADGGLAIAISDRGVTVPGAGEIPWERITGVRSFDMGIATGNVFIFAFQAWHGVQKKAYLTVFVRGTLDELGQLPKSARSRLVAGGPDGTWGFATAYRQGLGDAVWSEASAALLAEAERRGITIVR